MRPFDVTLGKIKTMLFGETQGEAQAVADYIKSLETRIINLEKAVQPEAGMTEEDVKQVITRAYVDGLYKR